MSPSGHTIEVTGLSPNTTEKDIYDFFAFSGAIDHVEIVRSGECACTAYVNFRNPHAQETAVLLSGATILDHRVCITKWGQDDVEVEYWNRPWNHEDEASSTPRGPQERSHLVSNAGEAVSMAQEVVKAMLGKGFVLGKDALGKAKALDESHQVSATAAAKVAELSNRFGLTDKICAGVGAVKSVDSRYHVSEMTKSAVCATGRTAAAAATTVVNSSYFSKGALWMSDALTRAAKVAADMGGANSGVNH